MKQNVYMLLTALNDTPGDIIYSRDTALRIKVYDISATDFKANDNEIQLYAWHNNNLLVFETIDITPDDAMDVILAIKWYARYLGCDDMEILPDDPRYNHENEIAI